MAITREIQNETEMRQVSFTAMREMANMVMDAAGFTGWSDYPWEAIDVMQAHLEAAQDAGDQQRIKKAEQLC